MSGARQAGARAGAVLAVLAAFWPIAALRAEGSPSSRAAVVAGLSGTLESLPAPWSGVTLAVHAAPYSGDAQGEGVFTFDEQRDRNAPLAADRSFLLLGLPAGRYVLVVGPAPEEGLPVVDADGRIRIFEVVTGPTRDLGRLHLAH